MGNRVGGMGREGGGGGEVVATAVTVPKPRPVDKNARFSRIRHFPLLEFIAQFGYISKQSGTNNLVAEADCC